MGVKTREKSSVPTHKICTLRCKLQHQENEVFFVLKIVFIFIIIQGKYSSFQHLASNVKCLIYLKLIL